MSWKLIVYLIALAINWYTYYLLRNNFFEIKTNKPLIAPGVGLLLGLIALIPIFNVLLALGCLGLLIFLIGDVIEFNDCNSTVKFVFNNDFFKKLFTR